MRILFTSGLIALCIIFLFTNASNAQIYEKLNGPYGGGGKVYEGKNGILFQFLTESNVNRIVYKSLTGGGSWKRVTAPPANQIYDPIGVGFDGNLYCAKFDQLYTSSNDGQSWTSINTPASDAVLTITALPNGTLLAAQSDKIFQSSNNGLSWSSYSLTGIDQFYFNKYTNQVYAGNGSSIFVSNDMGLTWQLFFSDDFGSAKTFVCSSNGFVFISGLGYIWKLNNSGLLIRKTKLISGPDYPVNIAQSTTGKMFADENYNSFYSDDYGENWIKFKPNGADLNIFSSFSSISNGSVFGVKITGSLYNSSDNGLNWVFSANGINFASLYEVEYLSENHLLALTTDGLFYSEDGGQSWSFIFFSNLNLGLYSKTNRIVHYGEEFLFSDYSDIYYFKDGKTPGVKLRKKINPASEDKLFINEKTGALFSVESPNNVYRSTDKGKNWSAVNMSGVGDFYSFLDGSLIVTRQDGLYRSVDNGDHWTITLPFAFLDNNRILGDGFSIAYIYFYNKGWKLLKSIDNGVTWDVVSIKDPNSLVIEPTHGQICNNLAHLFTGSVTGEIFRSVDQGSSYSVYIDGINSVTNLSLSPLQKLYLLTNQNGLWRTKISTSATRILTGNVFADDNKNCNKDMTEANIPKRLVEATNGNRKLYSFTDGNGDFRLPIEQGDYALEVHTINNYWTSCSKTISSASYNFNDTLHLGLQTNVLCPYLKVDLQSSILRRCEEATLYIDYSNSGTQKAKDAFIDLTLDPFFEFISSTFPVGNQNGNVYRFLIGDVDENTSGYFSIKVKVSCNASMGQIHCAEAHIFPDTACAQSSRAIIRTSANCLGDSIELIIRNDGNKDMKIAKNWSVIDLSNSNNNTQAFDGGTFYLSAGQLYSKRIASRARVLFIAEQDESYPYNKSSKTEIISCFQNPLPGAPPLSISNVDNDQPYLSKFCERNRGSFDPNELKGYPEGITDKRYIDNEQKLDYVIRFQNTGNDTAFNIRIENQIPLNELDLTTLSLGASSHPYHFVLTPQGKLIFSFSAILLPDSGRNERASHGFVQYSIRPVDKLSNGTRILNNALIYFDYNDGVGTNTDLHTIGNPVVVKVNQIDSENPIELEINPNPLQEFSSVIVHSISKNAQYKLSCLNVNSQQIWQKEFTGNHTSISKGELSPGVYILVLKNKEGVPLKSTKLIVE